MKIAYLSTFYPFRGGIAQFNASLCRALEKDHQVKAFTFTRQYPNILFPGKSQFVGNSEKACAIDNSSIENNKIDNNAIDAERILDTINPITYYSAARNILEFNPDIMLMKYWMPFFAPSLGYVAKRLKRNGTINISVLDNVIPHEKRPGDIALTKYFLKHNSGFVVMSNTVRQDLLSLKQDSEYIFQEHPLYDHFGAKVDKIAARKKLNIPPDKKVLLFFGFIRSYKGLDLLLEALNALPADFHLVIAGEAYGSFDKYDDMINKYNLGNRVTNAARYIEDSEVPLFFSAADVCVLPYKSATQSGIIGVSYHFGLPVVATDTGGLKEMIEPHGTGLMVDKPDAAEIAISIKQYFNSDTELFKANIDNYKEKASWDVLAQKIIEFYNDLKL